TLRTLQGDDLVPAARWPAAAESASRGSGPPHRRLSPPSCAPCPGPVIQIPCPPVRRGRDRTHGTARTPTPAPAGWVRDPAAAPARAQSTSRLSPTSLTTDK